MNSALSKPPNYHPGSLPAARPFKVALMSSGLGHIARGFEISTARLFRAINTFADLDIRLYAGGEYPHALKTPSFSRNSGFINTICDSFGLQDTVRWKTAYTLEQISFALGILMTKDEWEPDIIWTKEVPLAHILYFFRAISGLRYKIVFANGGIFTPSTFANFDFIQHLQPDEYERAFKAGIPAHKMNVLTNCIPPPLVQKPRALMRQELGLKTSDWVIVSVAAWNAYHKRIDYLIREVAAMQDPNVQLLLIGQVEPETDALKELANTLLPGQVQWLTVPESSIGNYLEASDIFVLCSLEEGLGAALVEAAMAGLPVICHPHGGSNYILQDNWWTTDLSCPGNLKTRLSLLKAHPPQPEKIATLKNSVTRRFDEKFIAQQFRTMILTLLSDNNRSV